MLLPKPSRIIKHGLSTLHSIHQFGMEKRIDLDLVSLALQQAATRIYQNHPDSADRLEPIFNTSFYIDIQEFPFGLFVIIKPNRVTVDCNLRYAPQADVSVHGDYHSLVQVFEGDEDGDSLFFSRKIKVKGNIEALVTLRNAIDNEDIDLVAEIAGLFGPLRRPAKDILATINQRMSAQDKHFNIEPMESRYG